MNKVFMMGRLTKDPEVRYNGDKAVARYSIAVDRRFKKDEADFFNCVSFGKQAEFVEKYLTKGTKVVLNGRLQNDTYTNKNGEKAYSMNYRRGDRVCRVQEGRTEETGNRLCRCAGRDRRCPSLQIAYGREERQNRTVAHEPTR